MFYDLSIFISFQAHFRGVRSFSVTYIAVKYCQIAYSKRIFIHSSDKLIDIHLCIVRAFLHPFPPLPVTLFTALSSRRSTALTTMMLFNFVSRPHADRGGLRLGHFSEADILRSVQQTKQTHLVISNYPLPLLGANAVNAQHF